MELFSDAGSIPAISTIAKGGEYHKDTPRLWHLTEQWMMAGIEGDRAERGTRSRSKQRSKQSCGLF